MTPTNSEIQVQPENLCKRPSTDSLSHYYPIGFESTTYEGNTPRCLGPVFDGSLFAFPQSGEKICDFHPKLHQKAHCEEPADLKSLKTLIPDSWDSLNKPSSRSDLADCQYECKYYLNEETNRRNRVLVWKFNNCGREFTKTWGLMEHYRVHTKERPFSWPNCNTRFTQKGSLIKHMRKNKDRGSHCK